MSPELESPEDLPDECQEYECEERPQKVIEVDLAGGETDRFALCMLCMLEALRRDRADNITVVGP